MGRGMTKTKNAPVAAGVDGSAAGAHAARWAAYEAELRSTGLVLVTVDTVTMSAEPFGGPISRSMYDSVNDDSKRVLRETAEDVRVRAPGIVVDARIHRGGIAAKLIELSWSTQLLVVGTRGHGEFTGLLVGSVAQALVGHARSSVLVASEQELDASLARKGSVVIGVDGSVSSDRALKEGFAEASARQSMVKAVHSPNVRGALANSRNDDAERRAETKEFLAKHLGPWQALYPQVPVECIVGEQSAARSLVHYGKEAKMIVVGSRGRGGFTGLVLGSVSHT